MTVDISDLLRLIPAWAGKTFQASTMAAHAAAHPRVGGENRASRKKPAYLDGSSPRGRGKRLQSLDLTIDRRLIPAWAGKTPLARRR